MIRKTPAALTLACLILGTRSTPAQDKAKASPEFSAEDRVYVGLTFSPDGTKIAASGEGFVAIWDTDAFKLFKEFKLRGLIDEVLFDPQMRIMIARGKAMDTGIWDVTTWIQAKYQAKPGITEFHTRPLMASFGDAVAAMNNGPTKGAPTWGDARSGSWSADRLLRWAEYPVGSCPASFDPNGTWLALSNGQKGIRLWDMNPYWPRRTEVREYPDFAEGRLEHANALAFHKRYLLLGEENGYITPMALQRWEDLRPASRSGDPSHGPSVTEPDHLAFRRHAGHVTSLSLSPDGHFCVSAGMDENVCTWGIDQLVASTPAKPEWTVSGHYAALSSDGRQLAVAEDKGVRLYDFPGRLPTGWIAAEPKSGRVVRLRFNPTGTALAVISCRCEECVPRKGGDVSLASYKLGHARVHQHGGKLEVWNLSSPGAKPK